LNTLANRLSDTGRTKQSLGIALKVIELRKELAKASTLKGLSELEDALENLTQRMEEARSIENDFDGYRRSLFRFSSITYNA
jgi:hypothetical protein